MNLDRKMLLAAGLGGAVGVSITIVATNAIPKVMERIFPAVMSRMMQSMDDENCQLSQMCTAMMEANSSTDQES